MKRFLMLMGVAVVAAAMYVAASPASQQAKTPTEKQFLALKKQVATLQKKVNKTQTLTNGVAAVLLNCVLLDVVPISIVGDGTGNGAFGYSFLPQGAAQPIYTTALDFLNNGTFANWLVPFVPPQDSACTNLIGHIAGTGGLRHNAASTRAALQDYARALSEKP